MFLVLFLWSLKFELLATHGGPAVIWKFCNQFRLWWLVCVSAWMTYVRVLASQWQSRGFADSTTNKWVDRALWSPSYRETAEFWITYCIQRENVRISKSNSHYTWWCNEQNWHECRAIWSLSHCAVGSINIVVEFQNFSLKNLCREILLSYCHQGLIKVRASWSWAVITWLLASMTILSC